MTSPAPTSLTACRWHIHNYGHSAIDPGMRYWWDNRDRSQGDLWVLQLQDIGEIILREFMDTGGFHDHRVPPDHVLIFSMNEASAYGYPGTMPHAMSCRWLTFTGAGLDEHMKAFRNEFGPVIPFPDGTQLRYQFDQVQQDLRTRNAPNSHQISLLLFQLLTTMFQEAESQHRDLLSPADSAIRTLLQNPTYPWSLKNLADDHGVSREHFTRCFIEQVGQSPARYLNEHRTRRAMELLSTTDLPLKHIAEQAGFPSIKTLSRQIQEHTGQTPHAWRLRDQS